MKHNISKLKGCSKNSSKREAYSDKCPHEKQKFFLKELEKGEQTKPKVSRKRVEPK